MKKSLLIALFGMFVIVSCTSQKPKTEEVATDAVEAADTVEVFVDSTAVAADTIEMDGAAAE